MFNKKKKDKVPYKTVTKGSFVFDFYYEEGVLEGTYLVISDATDRKNGWSLRIPGNLNTYLYLLSCALSDGDAESNLTGFPLIMYIISSEMFKSQKFVDDIVTTVSSYTDRLLSEAKEKASAVTDEDEAVSQYVMESLIKPHDSEEFKASVREVLKDVNQGGSAVEGVSDSAGDEEGDNEKANDSNDGNNSNE